MKVSTRGLAVAGSLVVLLLGGAPSVATALPRQDAQPHAVATRWHYHADVDGNGTPDRVVLQSGRDLKVRDGWGSGHYWLRVHLDSGRTVVRRMSVSYYVVVSGRWTPWYGKTQLDQRPGKELVLGRTSGAHSDVYSAVTYRGGQLHVLRAPDAFGQPQQGWLVNASYGTGLQGWRCTPTGVRSRSALPAPKHHRYRFEKRSYVWHHGWQLADVSAGHVKAGPHGQAPRELAGYATFACPGLPRSPA